MVITYHGENYFKINSGEFSLLIDPTNQRSYKGTNIILFTEREGEKKNTESEIFLIDHAGEFEINGIHVHGWQVEGNENSVKTVYRVELDEITIAIFGGITKELSQEFREYFEAIDIAIAPIGGKPTVPVPTIAKFLRQIEPGIIIPSLFTGDKQLKEFFKEFGGEYKSCSEKLVLKKKDIPEKGMQVECLKSE